MASYASSRVREVEHRSASACKYESGTVAIDDEEGWKLHTEDFSSVTPDDMAEYAAGGDDGIMTEGDDIHGKKLVKCQMLAEGTSIRVAPMERSCGGWANEHFHGEKRYYIARRECLHFVLQVKAIAIVVSTWPKHLNLPLDTIFRTSTLARGIISRQRNGNPP